MMTVLNCLKTSALHLKIYATINPTIPSKDLDERLHIYVPSQFLTSSVQPKNN